MAKEIVKESSFTLAALRKECRKLFDCSTSSFDGATNLLDSAKKYTVTEIKNIIEEWNKGVVK